MQIKENCYEILGITPSASMQEIKCAYRKMAFRHHPDRNQMSMLANEKMEEINEAYDTLSDSIKRKEYDKPLGYGAAKPKFNVGSQVRVISRSSPHLNNLGIVDKKPSKDNFRFWYMVKFELKGSTTISRFAEEELKQVSI